MPVSLPAILLLIAIAAVCGAVGKVRAMGPAAWSTALLSALFVSPALAQVPVLPAAPPEVVAESILEPLLGLGSQVVLDQIAGCVDSGTLSLEIDLLSGRVPVADAWKVEVVGTPTAALIATTVGGHVSRLDVAVTGGEGTRRAIRFRTAPRNADEHHDAVCQSRTEWRRREGRRSRAVAGGVVSTHVAVPVPG